MTRTRFALSLLLGLLGSTLFCAKAEACSCLPVGTPCEAYGSARFVFIGLVQSYEGSSDQRTYQIKVEETFLGNLTPTVKATSSDMACGYEFQPNRRYLIYEYGGSMNEKGEVEEFPATYCSRTRPLEEAEEDIRYLRTERHKRAGISIYGVTVRDYSHDLSLPEGKRVRPVPGIHIRIEGQGKSYDLLTDENGRYAVAGIAPGRYQITLLLPSNLRAAGSESHLIYVNDHGCIKMGFWIESK